MFPVRTDDIHTLQLFNGLTVRCVEYHKLPLTSITIMIKRGAERDAEGKEGLADLTAETLTLGTQTMSSQELALQMEKLGAQYSARSGWDASSLEVLGLSEDFARLMDLLGEMLQRPTFPEEEIHQALQRRISRLIQRRDQVEVIADELIINYVLAGTPYAHPTYGTIASLQNLEAGDADTFYRHHYTPRDAALLVIGNVTPETVWQYAEQRFGGWNNEGQIGETIPSPVPPRGRRIIVVNRSDLTQSQIRLGLLGIARKDECYIPFKVMNYIFGGGGFSSRLMQRVRAEKGYTYGIRSYFSPSRINGPFIISTFTPTATTVPVIEEIIKLMEEFTQQGAAAQELQEAKNFFVGSFPLKLETPGQMAREILELELYGIPFAYLSEYPQAILNVSMEKLNNLASLYVQPEDLIIVVVGRAEDFLAALQKMGSVEVMEYAQLADTATKGHAPRLVTRCHIPL